MQIDVLDKYKRRGATCAFTWRLSEFGAMKDADGESYTETFWWASCRWTGAEWVYVCGHGHELYPAPREPKHADLLSALKDSSAGRRAIAAIGVVP